MAKGLVVHTAAGTVLENYCGSPFKVECACAVCKAVYDVASQYAVYGFRAVKEVSYTFESRELRLTLDNGSYATSGIFLGMEVDVNAAVRSALRNLAFPLFIQEHSIA